MADEIIGGYRLQNLIVSSQATQVWEVVELSSHRHFAMKILLPEKAKDREARHQLFHDAEVGIKLRHPNLVQIITLNKEAAVPYFVMEFFPAGSLRSRLLNKQMDFIKERAHDIFRQAATGLAYMNSSGWVHRDIKPDNMLVNSAGELRLIDFAIAQRIQKNTFFSRLFRRKGKTAGTASYMSPEQIRNLPLDGRADVYSFGATVYELVTGRPPFRGNSQQDLLRKQIVEKPLSPASHNPDVTTEFANLILRMLAKKPEDRPRDFHEVLMAMRPMKFFKSQPAVKKP